MNSAEWAYWASVYRAGADRARGWTMNMDRQQDAEILDAQADRCEEIARELDGLPPVDHDHYHYHGAGRDRFMHAHRHAHGRGRADHEVQSPGHVHPERGPLYPPRRTP